MSGDQLLDACERFARARAASRRLGGLEREIADAQRRRTLLVEAHLREDRDVRRLEGWTLARFVAKLRGTIDDDLTKEQAEAEGARLEVVVNDEVLRRLFREQTVASEAASDLDAATSGVKALLDFDAADTAGSVDSDSAEVVEATRRWVAVHGEMVEVDEALAEADRTLSSLRRAGDSMNKAGGWSAVDLLGGGILVSLVKRGHLKDASEIVTEAQYSLQRLRAELADVFERPNEIVQMPSPTLDAFDVLLDNIFSDWLVHDRIKASTEGVTKAIEAVTSIRTQLREHRADLLSREAEIMERRRQAT